MKCLIETFYAEVEDSKCDNTKVLTVSAQFIVQCNES